MHYTYDVVWMALPVFLTANAQLDQALVVLCTLLPLLLTVAARLSGRPGASEAQLLEPSLNSSWQPADAGAIYGPTRPRPT